ncbi:putative c6 finger domain [Phaeomoniella chlamydospora]|uniref:Putative c6 finger domain n=1 Tax=Phaeomoniella chlamydospora TaxID=158046 RepID=A0A0G2EF19_PHACM|nr:putative c6 finger domain [Phaeomoniella chlamydospora]
MVSLDGPNYHLMSSTNSFYDASLEVTLPNPFLFVKINSLDKKMTYDLERYEKALAVWRETEGYLYQRGLSSVNLEQHLKIKYSLRSGRAYPTKQVVQSGLWVGGDESGDYGRPRQRRPSLKSKAKIRNRVDKLMVATRRSEKRNHGDNDHSIVTLKLNSPVGLSLLQSLAEQEYEQRIRSQSHALSKNSCEVPSSSLVDTPGAIQNLGSLRLRAPETSRHATKLSEAKLHYNEDFADHDSDNGGRAFIKCDFCRIGKKTCSLKRFSDEGPCKQCVNRGIECTFVSLEDYHRPKTLKRASVLSRISCRPKSGMDNDARVGRVKTINTPWSHPINFKHPPDKRLPCHFHNDHRYGMFGCGKRSVQVIIYDGSPAYREIGEAVRNKAYTPTRMCTACSLERVQMSQCRHSDLAAISYSELEENNGFGESHIGALFEEGLGNKEANVPSCSLCISPALFACCEEQHTDKWGDVSVAVLDDDTGCGLLFCSACAEAFMKSGNLPDTAEEAQRQGKSMRADFEFLLPDSLLLRAMEHH